MVSNNFVLYSYYTVSVSYYRKRLILACIDME